MRQSAFVFRSLVVTLFAVATTPVISQVPPHYPGTVCFTPYLWCQLPGAVPVGTRCYCNTPSGPVFGQAG
jgi:hypothetical protein